MAYDIVVLGDSVTWGQGLADGQKMHDYVRDRMAATHGSTRCLMLAHSGAIIGVDSGGGTSTCDGEVPTSFPTILQQCDAAPDADVDLVILNGGINDIDIRYILNPFVETADLVDVTNRFCGTDMTTLLVRARSRFRSARIVVTSYYPILSRDSHFPMFDPFMLGMGMPIAPLTQSVGPNAIFDRIVRNCATFYDSSNQALQAAVDAANGDSDRIVFAKPPFTDRNAALASEAWLFGIDSALQPEDPVAAARHASCDACSDDPFRREQCYRASVGHPNPVGAREFADAIIAALV